MKRVLRETTEWTYVGEVNEHVTHIVDELVKTTMPRIQITQVKMENKLVSEERNQISGPKLPDVKLEPVFDPSTDGRKKLT